MPLVFTVMLVVLFDDGFGHVAGAALVFDFAFRVDDVDGVLVLFVDFDTQYRCFLLVVIDVGRDWCGINLALMWTLPV